MGFFFFKHYVKTPLLLVTCALKDILHYSLRLLAFTDTATKEELLLEKSITTAF